MGQPKRHWRNVRNPALQVLLRPPTADPPGGLTGRRARLTDSRRSGTEYLWLGGRSALFALTLLVAACGQSGDESKSEQPHNANIPPSASVTISDEMRRTADSNKQDWLLPGRNYSNQRYSPLSQINRDNVKSLSLTATFHTGIVGSFEATPIVVNGVMYVTTPVVENVMKIMAINAVTGESFWEVKYRVDEFLACCGPVNRGPAVAYGKVYVATLDAKLLALDATNGKQLWLTPLADPQSGYAETMTPQVYEGLVIVGSSGGEWGIRGFVTAIDAETGKERWRWHSTDPNTYAGDSWKTGGGGVWNTPAIDPELGLVMFAVGNPNPQMDGRSREGDNLYTCSIVALDVKSGTLKWFYQEVRHDLWDYDAASNVVLFDADYNGTKIPAAGQAGKVGWLFIVNRVTGELIRKSEPFVNMSHTMFTTPSDQGVKIFPGSGGGAQWSPPSYDPETDLIYILGVNMTSEYSCCHSDPTSFPPNVPRKGSADDAVGPKYGVFSAIDVNTGKIAWKHETPQPLIGGALATHGGLVFVGEGSGWFDAFDARTGELLWRHNLGSGINAPPISYEVNGEQYIAVAAGGIAPWGFAPGDSVAIFKLSGDSSP
jgi:alcohol dehydrogenase (cytochrome c)